MDMIHAIRAKARISLYVRFSDSRLLFFAGFSIVPMVRTRWKNSSGS